MYILTRGYADVYMNNLLIDTLVPGDSFCEAVSTLCDTAYTQHAFLHMCRHISMQLIKLCIWGSPGLLMQVVPSTRSLAACTRMHLCLVLLWPCP